MQVRINELREVANKLLSHVESLGHDTIELNHDYYWCIPASKRYDPYVEPDEFTMGQLSDDLNELERIRKGDSDAVSFALVWLSSVMTAIGEQVVG